MRNESKREDRDESTLDNSGGTDAAFNSECSICLDRLCTHVHGACGAIFCGPCTLGFAACPKCRAETKSPAADFLAILPATSVDEPLGFVAPPNPTTEALQKQLDEWTPKKGGIVRCPVVIRTLDGTNHRLSVFTDMPLPRIRGSIALAIGVPAEEFVVVVIGKPLDVHYTVSCRGAPNTKTSEDRWPALTTLALQDEIDLTIPASALVPKIRVIINTLDGVKRSVLVLPEARMRLLRSAVAAVSNVAPEQIRFVLRGHPLCDDATLAAQKVGAGDTLHCIMQMRGS